MSSLNADLFDEAVSRLTMSPKNVHISIAVEQMTRKKTQEFSDQTPTEPRDKLPVKRSMNPSDASEDIDLTNNAAKQNLSSMLVV
ncbi:hypothetical protein DPMN_056688 [Dreissena polymorpha]|uniref:Uncharacterized protein n=1 Tax=Dreissena polymorpha TaxID=45954 RepID=A0A9D4CTR5_DREPO|nr:hypothetical protein DPMN_056688 [Dreissena polymorpha]